MLAATTIQSPRCLLQFLPCNLRRRRSALRIPIQPQPAHHCHHPHLHCHRLLHYPPPPPPPPPPRPPLLSPAHPLALLLGLGVGGVDLVAAQERDQEKELEAQIAAVPLFTLASAAPKSSGDCAVCLSRFRPHDALHLLPACCHAFHAACVDAWLRSTPSYLLCRASIVMPAPSPPPPVAAAQREAKESKRLESFRVKIGSISRCRSSAGVTPVDVPPHRQSYLLSSAFNYLVEEEVEAVVVRALQRLSTNGGAGAPTPPEVGWRRQWGSVVGAGRGTISTG